MPAIAKTAKVVVTPDGGLTKINTVYTFATEANIKTPAKAHETVTVLPAEFEDAATIKLSSPLMAIASPVKTLAIRPKPKKSRKKESKLPKAPLPEALPDSVRHDLERKLGRIFYNPELLWEALQASANNVTQIGDLKIDDGNKKLAFLGDAVVKTTLLADWLRSGESRRQGHELTVSVGNNKNLDKVGRKAGLEPLINTKHTVVPPKTMSATVEALIGAVYVDSGESLGAVKVAMKGLGLWEA